ncbi:MAG: ArdC-like ssDNA-binding domain-containing protein [Acidimicrobiales bacterium]
MLIASQRPEGVTRVAGYRRWQSLGRQVRKGEQGIAILAPVLRAAMACERRAMEAGCAAAAPSMSKSTLVSPYLSMTAWYWSTREPTVVQLWASSRPEAPPNDTMTSPPAARSWAIEPAM